MRGRDHKDASGEREITAQPKGLPDEIGTPVGESGLSVAPEDLGRQFLSHAIEQGNFESERGGEAAELAMPSDPPSDESLSGPNFESDRSVWESTVDLALQSGGPEGAQEAIAPPRPNGPGSEEEEEEDLQLNQDGDIDLTESVIQEASLFDHESDELGETVAPGLRTEDGHSHAKKRGGHLPKSARPAPRAR